MIKISPRFFQKQKRKDKYCAPVIGFSNANFCSEKGDIQMKREKLML